MRALALLVLLLAGLSSASAETMLRIGYQRVGPLVILRQQHQLAQALAPLGVGVQWVEFNSGPPLMEALNAGSIDFGYGGDTPPIFAAAAGVDFVLVASQPMPGHTTGLMLPAGSTVQSVEALRGKIVAVTKGSSAHNFLVRLLEAHGMTPADVHLTYLQPADAAAAFHRGGVDAWAIWDPFFALVQRQPGARLLADAAGVAPTNAFFFARRAYAQAHPAVMTALVDQINEAARWAAAHPADLAALMAEATGVDPAAEAVASARGSYAAAFLTPSVIAEEQQIADRFVRLHIIPSAVDIAAKVYVPAKVTQ